jgi:branched-chain amino acid transport system permease protein
MSTLNGIATPPPTGAGRWLRLRGRRLSWPVGYLIAAIALFVFFYLVDNDYLGDSIKVFVNAWLPIKTVNHCLIWAMSALGLNIVVGYAGLLDLGYVAFWALGSYVSGWLMSTFIQGVHITIGGNPPLFSNVGFHVNFWLVLIVAAAFAALLGVLIGAPTLRLRSDYLAVVTLGFGEIIPQFFHNADKQHLGVNISNGTQGIGPIDTINGVKFPDSGGLTWGALDPFDATSRYLFYVILVVIIVFVSLRLRVGRLGRAWLAIREDELAASSMGVPLMRTKLSAYAVGAIAGGIAGVCFAVENAYVSPDSFDFSKSIILLAMVVLGGMGNVWGVILGAFVVTWVNETGLSQLGSSISTAVGKPVDLVSYNFMIFGAALVLMMLFKREGFIPEARTKLVLREPGRTDMEALGSDMEELSPELDAITPDLEVGDDRRDEAVERTGA